VLQGRVSLYHPRAHLPTLLGPWTDIYEALAMVIARLRADAVRVSLLFALSRIFSQRTFSPPLFIPRAPHAPCMLRKAPGT
jgi:hypothetical protein